VDTESADMGARLYNTIDYWMRKERRKRVYATAWEDTGAKKNDYRRQE
jgi:hypothetical protein